MLYEYKHWHVPVFVAAFAAAIFFGGLIYVVGFYPASDVVDTFVSKDLDSRAQNSTINSSYTFYSDPIYTNKEFGFQVQMPATWTKYAVGLTKGTDGTTLITFALPLQSDKLTPYLTQVEQSANVIDRDNLEIMPLSIFAASQHDCDNADGPCSVPREIARNDTYVFAWLPTDPHAGWNFCADAAGKEPYLCSVYNDEFNPKTETYFIESGLRLIQ